MFVVPDCCDVPVPEGGFMDERGDVGVSSSLHPEDAPWGEGGNSRERGGNWKKKTKL